MDFLCLVSRKTSAVFETSRGGRRGDRIKPLPEQLEKIMEIMRKSISLSAAGLVFMTHSNKVLFVTTTTFFWLKLSLIEHFLN